MSQCPFCEAVAGKADECIYEDERAYAVLSPAPAAPGHIFVFPKKHYNIIEQVPDYEVGHLFNVANKLSTAVFEGLKVQGTNIILQNGIAAGQSVQHICVHIIPRRENDNIALQWKPKQLSEEEMSTVELQLKTEAKNIGAFEKEAKKEAIKLDEKKEEKLLGGEANYLIKQLRRIP